MYYVDMVNFLAEKTRNHTAQNVLNIKNVLNICARNVLKERNRSELNITATISTVSAQINNYIIDNPDWDFTNRIIIPPSQNVNEGSSVEEMPYEVLVERFGQSENYTPAWPHFFAVQYIRPVKVYPVNSTLRFVSSSTSDTATIVTVVGLSGGYRVSEEITMTGITTVATTNTYTEVFDIHKSARSVGTITVTDSAADVVSVISPLFLSAKYYWLRIHPKPDGVYVMTLYGKRACHEMYNDRDVPGDIYDEDLHAAVLAMAEGVLCKDPTLAAIATNSDKTNQKVNQSFGLRSIDRRAWRDKLERRRYRGY